MDLNILQPIATTKAIQSKLSKLEITTYWDLLLHIPSRYEDLTSVYPIAEAKPGMQVQVEGEIVSVEVIHKRTKQLQVRLFEQDHTIILIFFHFYPNYTTQYKVGKRIRAFGEIKLDYAGNKTIIHPKIQSVTLEGNLPNTFSPIYSTTQGLKQTQISKLIDESLSSQQLVDTLPDEILNKYKLLPINQAIVTLHKLTQTQFSNNLHKKALERLKFDEILAQQLILRTAYQHKHSDISAVLKPKATLTRQLLDSLPFSLTKAQTRVLAEIYMDIARPIQMNRLLQGDVGSGKTIVATLAMLVAVENGYQACIIAPTEILAEQHYLKTEKLLATLGLNVLWLSGSLTIKQKREAYSKVQSGDANIIIGTHAVLQEKVEFLNLALAVIDEQHRFGVEQRLALQNKGNNPHNLMMSATPIPRTLAQSYYADLDISTIDELPPGRTPIKTLLINTKRRGEVIEFIANECSKGRQIYWVCPLIDESEALELQTAINTYEELSSALNDDISNPVKVGLVHGRLKSSEKADVMSQFSQNQIQVLVATTVIEVGVDVPNASIMVIEHSERMGLSQLHQLRGRVGRGCVDSQCILLYNYPLSDVAKKRLKVIYENTDGFKIAHEDLLIRGPGELLGIRQSGLPILRFANLEEDMDILKHAKESSTYILEKYPDLASVHTKLWFNKKSHLIAV